MSDVMASFALFLLLNSRYRSGKTSGAASSLLSCLSLVGVLVFLLLVVDAVGRYVPS